MFTQVYAVIELQWKFKIPGHLNILWNPRIFLTFPVFSQVKHTAANNSLNQKTYLKMNFNLHLLFLILIVVFSALRNNGWKAGSWNEIKGLHQFDWTISLSYVILKEFYCCFTDIRKKKITCWIPFFPIPFFKVTDFYFSLRIFFSKIN